MTGDRDEQSRDSFTHLGAGLVEVGLTERPSGDFTLAFRGEAHTTWVRLDTPGLLFLHELLGKELERIGVRPRRDDQQPPTLG